ncbi:hypothetical protein ACLQ2E_34330 [Streptomyces lavendulocolor]
MAIQSTVDQIDNRTAPGGRTADGHHPALVIEKGQFGREGHRGLLASQAYREGHRAACLYVIDA